MATQQYRPRLPDVKFRVLIIGRANAGKTSILQRVCDTTESPEIYRRGRWGNRYKVKLNPTLERGQHDINDELIFSNNDDYIFHDSRGFEAGSVDELKIVQKFVKHKSREKRLKDRLHAIWYCIPMDNDRPSLDLKHFGAICPDNNVPVIAVFTKYDQFKHDIKMRLEDEGCDQEVDLNAEVENIFNQNYLASLNGPPPFIRLEKMQDHGQRCDVLIEITANALSGGAVALMLVAMQRDSLELSIKQAITRAHRDLEQGNDSTEAVIKTCMAVFPSLWLWYGEDLRNTDLELSDYLREEEEYSRSRLNRLLKRGTLANPLLSKLRSFNSDPLLCISPDDTHHTMIMTILILDCASLFYASPSRPTLDDALDHAYSQYKASDAHATVKEQFSLSPNRYSISQFIEFVLSRRLR